jgi:nucleoside-diphosphate-sugar epimerase
MSEPQNIVFRFAGAFGVSPQMRHDNLIHDFVHQATSGKPLAVYESHFIRQFVHVRDMVGAILFAMSNWDKMQGNIFNVGNSNTEVTKRQLVERIAKHFPFEYRFDNSGTDLEKRDYPVSFEKITQLGFKPQVDLDAGLIELINYYGSSHSQKELAYGG